MLTLTKNMPARVNKGEKAELYVKRVAFENKNGKNLAYIFGNRAADGYKLIDTLTDRELVDEKDLKKTASGSKSDLCLQFNSNLEKLYVSVKSEDGGNASVLNHTHRGAKVFQKIMLHHLHNFDKLVAYYIKMRLAGSPQELPLIDLLSKPEIQETRDSFVDLLSYFTFQGSGRGYQRAPANSVLIVKDDDMRFYVADSTEKQRNFIEKNIDKYIFSLRSKALSKRAYREDGRPWIFQYDGKDYGTMHIRVCKFE